MAEPEVERLRRRVSELEAEAVALRQARDEAAGQEARRSEALLIELQHRVKNMLAVVRAVVARTAETSDDTEGFVAHLSGRLGALARVQGVLTRTGEDVVGLDELVREELLSHGGFGDGQVSIDGPPVRLRGKVAEILGLALHELATNAVKYGALSPGTGRLQVRWRLPGHPDMDQVQGGPAASGLLLEWEESGNAANGTAALPTRQGFGRVLIEQGLPYELGAVTALAFRPGGMLCTVEVPLLPRLGVRSGGVLSPSPR